MTVPVTFEVEVGTRAVAIEVISNEVEVSPGTAQVIVVPAPGPRGLTGASGDGAQVFGESLTGTKDGANTVFTTAANYRAGSTAVYLNGLREFHYAETGANQVTLEDPPLSGDSLRIDYVI